MLPTFVEPFLQELLEDQHSERTIETYRYDLKLFFEWLEADNEELSFDFWLNLERKDYEAYFTYQSYRNSSQAKLKRLAASLNGLIAFYDLHNKIGHLKPSFSLQRNLTPSDFVTEEETNTLFKSIVSKAGLTENQKPMYEQIALRNLSIVLLMRQYGLTLAEVQTIDMQHINFAQNELRIYSKKKTANRVIYLKPEDKRIILGYYNSIPSLFRPMSYSSQPLFISYHAKTNTFYFDYEKEEPKRITIVGIKSMIAREMKRAGITRPISAMQLRNNCILEHIEKGEKNETVLKYFGLTSRHALYRYKRYLKNNISKR